MEDIGSVQSDQARPHPKFRRGGSLGSGRKKASSKRTRGSSSAPTMGSYGLKGVKGSAGSSLATTSSSPTTPARPRPIVGANDDHPDLSVEWNVVLRAALNPEIPTQALRLVAGLYSDVSGLAEKNKETGGVAYIDNVKIEVLTGLDHKTIRQVESRVAMHLGLISQISRGRRRLVEDKDCGEAGGWIPSDAVTQEQTLDRRIDLQGAAQILDPSRSCWGNGRHQAWRLAVCLVATRGVHVLRDVESIPAAEIRDLLGIGKGNVARARRSLIAALATEDRDPFAGTEESTRYEVWVDGRKEARGDEPRERREPSPVRPPEIPMREALATRDAEILDGSRARSRPRTASAVIDNSGSRSACLRRVYTYDFERTVTVDGRTLPALALLEDDDGIRSLIHPGEVPIRVWAREALPSGAGYLIQVRGDGDVVAVLATDFIQQRHETDGVFRTLPSTEYLFTHLPTYRDVVLAERAEESRL